jgi:hypothetical protein
MEVEIRIPREPISRCQHKTSSARGTDATGRPVYLYFATNSSARLLFFVLKSINYVYETVGSVKVFLHTLQRLGSRRFHEIKGHGDTEEFGEPYRSVGSDDSSDLAGGWLGGLYRLRGRVTRAHMGIQDIQIFQTAARVEQDDRIFGPKESIGA